MLMLLRELSYHNLGHNFAFEADDDKLYEGMLDRVCFVMDECGCPLIDHKIVVEFRLCGPRKFELLRGCPTATIIATYDG